MTAITKSWILLNQAQLGTNAAAGINLMEWTDLSWADELAVTIDVQQVVNAPTAGTLSARFQSRLPHRGGDKQYNKQRLTDLTPEEKAGMFALADWPTTLAAYNFGSVLTYRQVVRNFGSGVNLRFTTTGMAGGAGAAFQVTCTATAKGRA